MTPQWHQHTRTRNPFHRGSRVRMFNEFGVDGLYDSGYEVAEGYLAVKNHGEFLFQSFYCWVMVDSVDVRLVWGLRWRKRHRSNSVDSYIHDASQRGCIWQRQKHGVQSQTRSRWTKEDRWPGTCSMGGRESKSSHGCSSHGRARNQSRAVRMSHGVNNTV